MSLNRFASEGLHPRIITEGYDIARDMVLELLEGYKIDFPEIKQDRELLTNVVRTSLKTKLSNDLANSMSDAIVSAKPMASR